jgi:hypothetical protein
MTTTVASILATASQLANDTDNVTWTQPELVGYFNEGQLALVKIKPDAYAKTATVALIAGAKQTNPADCIEIIELRRNTNGAAITPCDRSALDLFNPNWMTTQTETTVIHYMDDPQPDTFYVYPALSGAGSVQMTYRAVPPTVAYGDNMGVRDVYKDNMVNYLLYRMYSKDFEGGDAQRAAAYLGLFKG